MDRSTRNLSIITLLVLAIFLGLNHVARRTDLLGWGDVLLFLLLAVAIWFYDRVSRRGVDDSEASDTVIEPLVYDHASAPIGIPDTIQLVAPNPGTVIHAAHPAPPAPAHVEPVAPPPAPAPVVEAKAAPTHTTPAPELELPTPATSAAPATTIQEKAAPPPSAPAAETHPDLAAKTPAAANLPSTPVKTEAAAEPVPTPVAGMAPEPVSASPQDSKNLPSASGAVPPKTATELGNPYAKELGSEDSVAAVLPVEPAAKKRGKGKAKPAAAPKAEAAPPAPAGKPDDLKVIEGIGPKMEKALNAAGITTFAQLAASTEEQINAAIVAAGMRFAPSVPTWAVQASYAAKGDQAGLEAYQKTLVGGRKAK